MKINLTKHSTHARLFLTYKQPLARRIIPTLREQASRRGGERVVVPAKNMEEEMEGSFLPRKS